MKTSLTIRSLKMAISRGVSPGLTHHSDRSSYYADADSVLLKHNSFQISMSRRGNPHDNAKAETFMNTLQYKRSYRTKWLDLADARPQIGRFIDIVHNRKRLHSASGHRSPIEFEQRAAGDDVESNACRSVLRHRKIYRSDEMLVDWGRQLLLPLPVIVSMSFQLIITGELPSGRVRLAFVNRG
jgi:integrase-like protein